MRACVCACVRACVLCTCSLLGHFRHGETDKVCSDICVKYCEALSALAHPRHSSDTDTASNAATEGGGGGERTFAKNGAETYNGPRL